MALAALLPRSTRLLRVQAIGMHPAAHLVLAVRRLDHHLQGTNRLGFLALQGLTQRQRFTGNITQDHTEGVEPHDERRPLDRVTHALGLRITASRQGDIAGTQGEMLQGFAGMDIADEYLDKLQGYQVHREVQAMVDPFGAGRLHTAGIDDHKAQPLGQRRHCRHRQHLP
jgi:hypothetical protein